MEVGAWAAWVEGMEGGSMAVEVTEEVATEEVVKGAGAKLAVPRAEATGKEVGPARACLVREVGVEVAQEVGVEAA